MEPKRSGKPGRYFEVRNWLSEYGLSSETWGRRMGFDDAQVGQQQRHGFGFHRRPAIGVHSELAGRDLLRAAGVLDQALGQFGAFAIGDHPAHHVTAEDIQDDVEVISRSTSPGRAAW